MSVQLRLLQPQLHLQRLRDHQVAVSDPKQSSKLPPSSRIYWNAIHQPWTHWNAIQLKQRQTKCKLYQELIFLYNGHILSYGPRESQNIKPLSKDCLTCQCTSQMNDRQTFSTLLGHQPISVELAHDHHMIETHRHAP